MPGVKLTKLIEKMHLKNLTPDVPVAGKYITVPQINRPALQLTGYFQEFDYIRVQIIGIVENNYLQTLSEERKKEIYQKLLEYPIPCIIYTTDLEPEEELLKGATAAGIPVLSTNKKTSPFQAEVIRWLNVELAPCISIHGVLVDVYGVGVLIRGESGIGKSELALELIKRGHRLVTDDAVEIRKVSDETLVGSAPSITKHLHFFWILNFFKKNDGPHSKFPPPHDMTETGKIRKFQILSLNARSFGLGSLFLFFQEELGAECATNAKHDANAACDKPNACTEDGANHLGTFCAQGLLLLGLCNRQEDHRGIGIKVVFIEVVADHLIKAMHRTVTLIRAIVVVAHLKIGKHGLARIGILGVIKGVPALSLKGIQIRRKEFSALRRHFADNVVHNVAVTLVGAYGVNHDPRYLIVFGMIIIIDGFKLAVR